MIGDVGPVMVQIRITTCNVRPALVSFYILNEMNGS